MTDTTQDKKIETTVATETKVNSAETKKTDFAANSSPKREFRKNKRSNFRGKKEKPRSEFETKIIDIRRVARVSKGGRRFSFSVVVISGDKKGRVGVGTGKAGDTALAVEKATKNAKKNMIKIKSTKSMSIPYEVSAKYCSARVMMMPAKGKGVVAGSALRDIIEYSGLNDVNSKILSGSKNKLNIARATIKALEMLNNLKRK